MANQQSPEQHAEFQRLCRENGLDPKVDVWQQPQSKAWIIARTGIEKIQYKNGIEVTFDMVSCQPEFACVKATATRKVKSEGKATATKLITESFGSAIPGNCRINYYAEMAEKRALSRAVLKNMGFYALGVYGEDEADDFKQPANAAATLPLGYGTPVAAEAPKKPVAEASALALAPPAAATGAGPNSGAERQEQLLAEARAKLLASRSKLELKELYNSLTAGLRAELQEEFTAARLRIEADIAHAATTPVREAPAAMKVAGTATDLVDEFEAQPLAGAGPAVEYATAERQQAITRLLNHPLITRGEKTKMLTNINRLDEARADQAIAKLRKAIEDREGSNGGERAGTAEGLRAWVNKHAEQLGRPEVDRLLLLADTKPNAELLTEWNAAKQGLTEGVAA